MRNSPALQWLLISFSLFLYVPTYIVQMEFKVLLCRLKRKGHEDSWAAQPQGPRYSRHPYCRLLVVGLLIAGILVVGLMTVRLMTPSRCLLSSCCRALRLLRPWAVKLLSYRDAKLALCRNWIALRHRWMKLSPVY